MKDPYFTLSSPSHRKGAVALCVFLLVGLIGFPPSRAMAQEGVNLEPFSRVFPSLSSEERSTLEKEGEVTRYYFEAVPPLWLPRQGLGAEVLREVSKIETVIGVESIHLLPYAEAGRLLEKRGQGTSETPARGGGAGETVLKADWALEVYNKLLSISTMKGLEYYSASRGRMRTLFVQSYRVQSPQDLKPLPDPRVGEVPSELTLFVFQEDLTFGKNVSQWRYRSQGNEIVVSITNLTPLKYSFLTVAEPGNMQIHLLVLPAQEGIVFYGCMVAKSPRFLGLEKTRTESFYNRVKALYSWFKKGM